MSSAARVSHAVVKLPVSSSDLTMFHVLSQKPIARPYVSTSADALLTSRGFTVACLSRAAENSEKDYAASCYHDLPLASASLNHSPRLALGSDVLDASQLTMLLPAATSTSVQDWLDEQRRQEGDPKHIQAVEALALLLENKASPPETARSITTTYEPTVRAMVARASGSDSYHNKLYSFWALYFCGTVQTFGNIDTHERLIDLLVEISRQPDLLDEDGEPVTGYRDSVYWSDVPDWNRAFVEDGLCDVSRKIP